MDGVIWEFGNHLLKYTSFFYHNLQFISLIKESIPITQLIKTCPDLNFLFLNIHKKYYASLDPASYCVTNILGVAIAPWWHPWL